MCKRILAMSAALALTLSMAACGKAESETTVLPSGTTSPSATTQPSQTTQPSTVPQTEPVTEPAESEIILADDDNCTVKVTGFDEAGLLGFDVKVFLENKTEKNLMFSLSDVSVNGFMIDPFWASSVAAGKKANETVTFLESDFKTNGIEAVEEITFTLRVYDNDNWTDEDLVKQTFTVNP